MAHLHSCDPPVLHLDLKVANVLMDETGNARICDFGLSRQIRPDPRRTWQVLAKVLTPKRAGAAPPPSRDSGSGVKPASEGEAEGSGARSGGGTGKGRSSAKVAPAPPDPDSAGP